VTVLAWAERVFHVLAHVRATAHLAPSVYDPRWIARVERVLGPARTRTLAEDAATLGVLAPDHHTLAHLQLVAWLFDTPAQAEACADRELARLAPHEVAAPEILPSLVALGPAAEVLRAAAELEDLAALPGPAGSFEEVLAGLASRVAVAPSITAMRVEGVRSLRLRGRVRGDRIWVGVPDDDLPSWHPIWQALHEATVAEVRQRAGALAHAPLEQAATALLAHRAQREGFFDEHRRWFAHFGEHAPSTRAEALSATLRALLDL